MLPFNVREGDRVWDIKVKVAPIIGISAYEQRLFKTDDDDDLYDLWTYGSDEVPTGTHFHVKCKVLHK